MKAAGEFYALTFMIIPSKQGYMDKSNLEEQNADEFCRNIPLEEHGCSPCPFSGIVASDLEIIPFEDGKRFLYELSVEDEDY
ncbi:3781_t:CDS:2 [Entrophospora sp. SA101]|nr:3781_t:CDS:2 [Entrophospora sp. SA101]